MIFVCPKCGKKIELSVEALIASEYHAVCPQCLTRLEIVGDTAIIPAEIPVAPKPKPVQTPVPPSRESAVKQQPPQPAKSAQPVIPAIPVQQNKQPLPPKYPTGSPKPYYPTGSPEPYYPTGSPQPYYPAGSPQPYYPTGSPQPYYPQQPPQEPKKDNYSCTCTGCAVWGFVLLGILVLLFNMCNPIFG